jgi:hypothetical protein
VFLRSDHCRENILYLYFYNKDDNAAGDNTCTKVQWFEAGRPAPVFQNLGVKGGVSTTGYAAFI